MPTDLEQMLRRVLVAFNEHDLDAIVSHFAEDCVFETPRGPDRWRRRFVGMEEVRRGPAARFERIPDVHYGDDDHVACGDRGVSEWTIGGTTVDGEHIDVRGGDLRAFDAEGKIVRKDELLEDPRDAMSSARSEGPSAEPATKETRWASWS